MSKINNILMSAFAVITMVTASACTPEEVTQNIRQVESALSIDIGPEQEQDIQEHWAARNTVNSLPYAYGVREPAEQAFRIVTAERGWSQAAIDAWVPFAVGDVMRGESGYCWNVRGGAQMAGDGSGCAIARQGRKSDSGFAQLISLHYRPGAWLCVQEGLCSAEDIIATPWNSMTSFVALLERSGKQPWCYSSFARRIHPGCSSAPSGTP